MSDSDEQSDLDYFYNKLEKAIESGDQKQIDYCKRRLSLMADAYVIYKLTHLEKQ